MICVCMPVVCMYVICLWSVIGPRHTCSLFVVCLLYACGVCLYSVCGMSVACMRPVSGVSFISINSAVLVCQSVEHALKLHIRLFVFPNLSSQ